MLHLLSIAGAVALILFGISDLREGLERLFGSRLGWWMQRLASNRLRAFLSGMFIAVPAPSSTTIAALTVQAIQSGQLNSVQALAVMLGANIGLTVTAFLIGLNLDSYAPLLILVGVGLFQYTGATRSRGIGQVLLSLGLIFLAVFLIRQYVDAVIRGAGPDSDLSTLIEIAERHPVWLLIIAAAITMGLQSSTATIGLVIGLMAGGVNSLDIAFASALGANVGLALTALMLGWRQIDSRRTALSNLALKSIVALALLACQGTVVGWVNQTPGTAAQQVAYIHTGYNVLVALVGLPLVPQLGLAMERLIPTPPAVHGGIFGPRYITERPSVIPSLALGQSQREIVRVSEIVREMLDDLWVGLKTNNEKLVRVVAQRDDEVDLLDREIKRYLIRLGSQTEGIANSHEQINQLTYLAELESIGDIIDKNLSEIALKKIHLRLDFTPDGWAELDDFYRKVAQNLLIADTAFTTRDRLLAQQLLRHKEHLGIYERELRDRHFARLNSQVWQSHETSAIHLDILTHLKRINSCVTHVGYAIMQSPEGESTPSSLHPRSE